MLKERACMGKWVLLLMAVGLTAQEKQPVPPVVPADCRADTYAVYSALMTNPKLGHPDTSQKYLIVDETYGSAGDRKDIETGVTVPSDHREEFQEALADVEDHPGKH